MRLRKISDVIRLYIVSPEVLVVISVVLLDLAVSRVLVTLAEEVTREDSLLRYIAAVPLALLAATFHLAEKTLRPSEPVRNKVLYEWPDYWRLKYRSLGCVFWCVGASVGSVGTWVFKMHISLDILGGVLLASILVSLVAALTQFLAYLRVREMLESGL